MNNMKRTPKDRLEGGRRRWFYFKDIDVSFYKLSLHFSDNYKHRFQLTDVSNDGTQRIVIYHIIVHELIVISLIVGKLLIFAVLSRVCVFIVRDLLAK